METYVINRDNVSVTAVIEGIKKGVLPLCPVCKSPVNVALTPEEARAQGIPPGMQCSKNPRHFQMEFNIRPKK